MALFMVSAQSKIFRSERLLVLLENIYEIHWSFTYMRGKWFYIYRINIEAFWILPKLLSLWEFLLKINSQNLSNEIIASAAKVQTKNHFTFPVCGLPVDQSKFTFTNFLTTTINHTHLVDQAECDDNEISCDSGKCIPRTFACDGVQDCDDGADEEGCPPQKGIRLSLCINAPAVFCLMLSKCCDHSVEVPLKPYCRIKPGNFL